MLLCPCHIPSASLWLQQQLRSCPDSFAPGGRQVSFWFICKGCLEAAPAWLAGKCSWRARGADALGIPSNLGGAREPPPSGRNPRSILYLLRGPHGSIAVTPSSDFNYTLRLFLSLPSLTSLLLRSWNLLPNKFPESKSLPQALLAQEPIQDVEGHSQTRRAILELSMAIHGS